jgi:hypothetical protein
MGPRLVPGVLRLQNEFLLARVNVEERDDFVPVVVVLWSDRDFRHCDLSLRFLFQSPILNPWATDEG